MNFKSNWFFAAVVLISFWVGGWGVADDSPRQQLPLKKVAAGMFDIGVGLGARAMESPDAKQLLQAEFNFVTPENCLKPAAVQNSEGQFEFGESDRFMEAAAVNGQRVVGHCLVWAKDDRTPEWFLSDGDQAVSKEVLLKRMKNHIDKVVGRYGDQVDQWDVVNEALESGDSMWRESGWRTACGPEFIVKAFEYAHAADPTALLVYNDYRCELPEKRENLFGLIKYLKAQKAPIHAIGLQGHYELDAVPFEDLDFTLTEIKKLGLKVVISEVDIDVVKRGKWWADGNRHREELKTFDPYKDGCSVEVLKRQAQQYGKLFRIYAKHADNIERVTFWNLHDGDSWLNHFPWTRANHPLLFDRQLTRKPAFYSVQKVLCERREKQGLIPIEEFPLWKKGAPGFEERKNEPEQAQDWWVKNIHNPTLTPLLPDSKKSTGEAIIIVPGGGHRLLVFNAEGIEAAQYLRDQGITCFVLKHRLAREKDSPYSIEKHALEDGQRAVRYVRANAENWGIDADKIGMLGFSAGGEVVSMVAYADPAGDPEAKDSIDRASAKINFQLLVYPGPLGIPPAIPADAPPAFLLVANDDGASRVVVSLLDKFRHAKVPVELHLYRKGGHGFNMGNRSKRKSIQDWPARMADWLQDNRTDQK
ncbi:MAG: endo-1,4-beta-xylanase [Mariniblastus sp.]|nr:endo-1,4-beta-xylanase [Mariniblastus sp.]